MIKLISRIVRRLGGVTFWLRVSAVLTLLALALMAWSVLVPTPLPVMLAMTFGQALGTLAFAIFGFIVFKDLTRTRRERRDSLQNIGLSTRASRDSLQDIVTKESARKKRDSLQAIALTTDEDTRDSAQDIAKDEGTRESRDSLQNIALSKDES